jgi:hypothetical protein
MRKSTAMTRNMFPCATGHTLGVAGMINIVFKWKSDLYYGIAVTSIKSGSGWVGGSSGGKVSVD